MTTTSMIYVFPILFGVNELLRTKDLSARCLGFRVTVLQVLAPKTQAPNDQLHGAKDPVDSYISQYARIVAHVSL